MAVTRAIFLTLFLVGTKPDFFALIVVCTVAPYISPKASPLIQMAISFAVMGAYAEAARITEGGADQQFFGDRQDVRGGFRKITRNKSKFTCYSDRDGMTTKLGLNVLAIKEREQQHSHIWNSNHGS